MSEPLKLASGPTINGTLHSCPHCTREFFAPLGVLRCPSCDFIWFRYVSDESPAVQGTISVDEEGATMNLLTAKKSE